MKNLLFLVIVILLAGCASELENTLDSDLLKSAKMVDKDLKMINITGNFYYEACPDGCLPVGIQAVTVGEGNSTHMGKFDLYERYCVDENGMPIYFVEGYLTAANGDKVTYVQSNHWIDEDTGVNHSENMITGGTGRFEEAEGDFTNSVIIDWANASFVAEATGKISY